MVELLLELVALKNKLIYMKKVKKIVSYHICYYDSIREKQVIFKVQPIKPIDSITFTCEITLEP